MSFASFLKPYKLHVYCVLFDVRKAFDRVQISTLLSKLWLLAVPDYIVFWLKSYWVRKV